MKIKRSCAINFQAVLGELEEEKAQQDAMMSQAAAKRQEAEKVVADASSKVSSIESERARLAELQAKAAQMEEKSSRTPLLVQIGTLTLVVIPRTTVILAVVTVAEIAAETVAIPHPSSGWQTGVASAYGGSSDPNTPNPGWTSTGAICDDYSMGVAVPMAWPNYWQYYGHAVEISYGGRSVIATINDCGGMGGGSRSLDLQPGVFKALGYSTLPSMGYSYGFLSYSLVLVTFMP